MSQQNCLVCATDEGIFLDIFSNNNLRDNVETCLSLKTKKSDLLSTKICHKCAYELDQCSKFVKKYQKTQIENGMLYKKHGFCSLCMEPGKKGLIFDLINENPLNNPQEKIHRLFNVDGNFSNLSICLDCRYNLDVLFDLKCILNDHSDHLKKVLSGNIKTSPNMSKIKTNVVRRKTTSAKTTPTKLTKDILSEMDSDTSLMSEKTLTRLRSNGSTSSPQNRQCGECHAKIPVSDDMFRYHASGLTVCKQCWANRDPDDNSNGKKRKTRTKTKICSVFLQDILTSSDNKLSTVEKDEISDSIYTISDDSTVEESKTSLKKTGMTSKYKRKNKQNELKLLKKPKNDLNLRKSTRTRASSVQNEQIEKKVLRSSRAKSVEVIEFIKGQQLHEKKNSSEMNKSKSRKRTNELSKLNLSSEKINKKNVLNVASKSRKRTRDKSNSSISSFEENKSLKIGRKMSKPINRKVDSDSENSRPYTCNICQNDFDNRVEGLTHELSHSKSLEVILQKVTITDNADNKSKNDETEQQNDKVLDITDNENNQKGTESLNIELKEPSIDKVCKKDDKKETPNQTQSSLNTSEECEGDKTNSDSKKNETINDEINDGTNNENNDEKCDNNDSPQNNSSNIEQTNNKKQNNEKNDNNDSHETKKDQTEREDSPIAIDTSSDNVSVDQKDHEKDNSALNIDVTYTDCNIDNSVNKLEEKLNEASKNIDKQSPEKMNEVSSDVTGNDEILVNHKNCEKDEKEKDANEKIELNSNNRVKDSPEKTNDNNDDNDNNSGKEEEEKKDEENKEKHVGEVEKNEEKNEKDVEDKEKSEINEEKSNGEKEYEKIENIEKSSQSLHDETKNDSLVHNEDETLLNIEDIDDEKKDDKQVTDETVENDKNFECDKSDEKKNVSDDEDEGILIEKEMEKIKNNINSLKKVDRADVDRENIENNVELNNKNNDNKSLSK